MTEQPDKIEHKCWCGRCRCWYGTWVDTLHQDDIEEPKHCPDCGCDLDPNGIAYRMARAEHAAKLWASVVKLKEEYLRLWEAVKQARGVGGIAAGARFFDWPLTPEEVAALYAGDTEGGDG